MSKFGQTAIKVVTGQHTASKNNRT